MSTEYWPTIRDERAALAADLQGLSDDRWRTTTLCSNWSVADLLAHITATARITPASFFAKLLASGLSFERMQAKDIAREAAGGPAATLARFDSVISSKKHPPGPPQTMLGETIVHAEDIRRSLGIPHAYPMEAVVTVADFYKGFNLVLGTKRRIAGLRLEATDTE